MQKLIDFSLKYRVFIIIAFAIIALGSIFVLDRARVDAIPDIGENQQIIFTEWSGRSPKDIEEQITYPLSIILQGIPGIDRVRGTSAFGFSTVYVIFKDDVDFYWSRSRVLEKLSTARSELPEGVNPSLGPDATGLGQIFWYTLDNKPDALHPKSLQELRSLQDFYVRYLLQATPGVSEVASIGGFVKEYQVDVDPNKIFAFDIHFPQIIKAIKNSNIDVGAEVIEDGDRELIVRGVGFLKNISDIEEVVVAIKNGTPIRVKDLASVQIGPAFRRGALDKNGSEVVGGIVTMRYGENPARVINEIKEKLKQIRAGLPKEVVLEPFYDRSELVDKTMGTVYSALTQEIIITVFVILFFLLHFKSSVLVSLTLPFGVGISFILMHLFSIDSNIMSLSGLVIAIGSMVDIGIIMTENIYSHIADHRPKTTEERLKIIADSAKEIGPAILTAVLTTIITFIPVFALDGAEGKLFVPLAWAKTLAMIGAVIVAIILIPVLSLFFLKDDLRPIEKNKVSTTIIKWYTPTLDWILEHRKTFLALPLIFLILGLFAYTRLGKEFMPALNEGDILYMPVTTPDVSITKARELLSYTDKKIKEHPLVETAVGKLGRADTSLDPAPVAMFETLIRLKPQSEWPSGTSIYDIMEELDGQLQIPGLVNSWDFPIQTRIGMISTGIKTQVAVKIFGDNLKKLETLGREISQKLESVPGAYGIYAEQINGKPYIEFEIDRVKASRYGVNTGDINSIIQTAVGGMTIGQMYEGRQRYPIRVRYKKELRDRIDNLKNVLVATPSGLHIPVSQLADIKVTVGPAMIQSENGLLRSTVQLNVRDRDVIGFVEEAKAKIEKEVELPPGYSLQWAGQFENQKRATQRLMILIPLSLIINLLIIYFGFRSFSLSAIVFTAVPIAAAGGLILLWLMDVNTSVAVWVGFIALFGIAVDDGVVMITFLREALKKYQPTHWQELKKVIQEAGSRRIRPLIMTTTTTIIALLPIMWSTGQGSEVMKPMAIPVLGGMAIELISLFVVPVIFSYIYQKKIEQQGVNK
ncbi:MAG: CusA/CzcA family heavy metal efflux RND transporter [Halobacteriovoraceae bacterium]|nr:CusA/CzcA family heavy metal efflux RND transporter [Halobacteriovoraceae bacterium]